MIAQLGKNYTDGANERISGEHLLELALSVVEGLQYAAGGMVTFLEAEDKEKLLTFYQKNNFQRFSTRKADDAWTGAFTFESGSLKTSY